LWTCAPSMAYRALRRAEIRTLFTATPFGKVGLAGHPIVAAAHGFRARSAASSAQCLEPTLVTIRRRSPGLVLYPQTLPRGRGSRRATLSQHWCGSHGQLLPGQSADRSKPLFRRADTCRGTRIGHADWVDSDAAHCEAIAPVLEYGRSIRGGPARATGMREFAPAENRSTAACARSTMRRHTSCEHRNQAKPAFRHASAPSPVSRAQPMTTSGRSFAVASRRPFQAR
jgi:hypothetical protein